MHMPTQSQMDQVTRQAVASLCHGLGVSEAEVLTHYQGTVFHLVCAFAAQAAEAHELREARKCQN